MAQNAALTASFVDTMKEHLVKEKARLEREIAQFSQDGSDDSVAQYNPKFPQYGDEEGENAQEVADYAANVSIEEGLKKLLRDVDSALERLQKGVYGICKYCKKTIEEKRLEARPTSSACIECKKTITQEV